MALARAAAMVVMLVLATACTGEDESRETVTVAPLQGSAEQIAAKCAEDVLWTECPEADWVARFAKRAGFTVTGETQSALTVEGDGPSFYLWTTPESEAVAGERWDVLGRSAGVDVYGDELWQWWATQGRLVWLNAGPTADARMPTLAELAPLIRASREVAAPAAK